MYDVVALGELLIDFTESGKSEQGNQLLEVNPGGAVLQYFLALEEGINLFPGFAPELQGVYIEEDEDGRQVAWANVLTHERETELLGKAL